MNLMEKERAPHIRAYCVKEDFQRWLFNTNIEIHECQSADPPHNAVLLIYNNVAEERQIKEVLQTKYNENKQVFRGIHVDVLSKGNSRIEDYLSGDFENALAP